MQRVRCYPDERRKVTKSFHVRVDTGIQTLSREPDSFCLTDIAARVTFPREEFL